MAHLNDLALVLWAAAAEVQPLVIFELVLLPLRILQDENPCQSHNIMKLPGCELGQQTHLYDMLWETCHLGNMDPKALVTRTRHHLVQQSKRVLGCHSSHMQVTERCHLLRQLSKFVEVRGKQAEGLNFLSKMPEKQMSVDSTVCQILPQHKQVSCTYSAIAQAMPQPSYVEVPRPSSSMITSELLVVVCKDNATVILYSSCFIRCI